MLSYAKLVAGVLSAVIMVAATAHAATYVYVSNAEDGNIGMYAMASDGTLKPGARVQAGKLVMPMSRQPGQALPLCRGPHEALHGGHLCASIRKTGALKQLSKAPLAESFPYISAGQDRAVPFRRVLRRQPGQRQPHRQGRQGVRACCR